MPQYTEIDIESIRSRYLSDGIPTDSVLFDLAKVCDALEQAQKAVVELTEAKKTIWRLLSPPLTSGR